MKTLLSAQITRKPSSLTWLQQMRILAEEGELRPELPKPIESIDSIASFGAAKPVTSIEHRVHNIYDPWDALGPVTSIEHSAHSRYYPWDVLIDQVYRWVMFCEENPEEIGKYKYKCSLTKLSPKIPVVLNDRVYDLDAIVAHIRKRPLDPFDDRSSALLGQIRPLDTKIAYEFKSKYDYFTRP
ncbi:MAG: hypothetical protein KBD64_02225 [Gammaproteobacteria bacterium]|nr:hypothetical protein [Gammaproteobacteria bacterium]